jgi:hypothetical protein
MTAQAKRNVLRDITTASSPGFGDELVDRDAVAMILDRDGKHSGEFLTICKLGVAAAATAAPSYRATLVRPMGRKASWRRLLKERKTKSV